MSNIIISTKLKTTNIGNEALSNELIRMVYENRKQDDVIKFVTRPFGLDRYAIDQLNDNNLIEDFDRIAAKIANSTIKLEMNQFKESNNNIDFKTNLLNVDGGVVKTEKYRIIARKIRKFLFSFKLYSYSYKERLKMYKAAEFYLYSGAGEVAEVDYFYRQLLDLRVAQLMGLKTAAINQSVELPFGKYQILLGYVYSKMHSIVVRGDITKQNLIKMGINPAIINVCPDTAFRNEMEISLKQEFGKKIAINFTSKTFNAKQIEPILEKLKIDGYSIFFISNEPRGDRKIAEYLEEKYEIPFHLVSEDYKSFCNFIKQFDFLISSRLHANELAITAGVPTIPIEGNRHKTTEVFQHINYPFEAISYNADNYGEAIYERVKQMEMDFFKMQDWIVENINEIADNATNNIKKAI